MRFLALLMLPLLLGCQTTASTVGFRNESSEPINGNEAVTLKKELLRCLKTGGTRVIKLGGRIRCF